MPNTVLGTENTTHKKNTSHQEVVCVMGRVMGSGSRTY